MNKMEYEEMGMTEQQFASYLNQVIARLEDVLEIEDEGKERRSCGRSSKM